MKQLKTKQKKLIKNNNFILFQLKQKKEEEYEYNLVAVIQEDNKMGSKINDFSGKKLTSFKKNLANGKYFFKEEMANSSHTHRDYMYSNIYRFGLRGGG